MKPVIFLLSLLSLSITVLADMVETPSALLKRIPPIPLSLKTADCQAGKQVALRSEEISTRALQQLAPANMVYGSGGMAVTDAQGKALARLTDEELVQCIFKVSMGQELVSSRKQSLSQELDQLNQQMMKDDARCGNTIGSDAACHDRVVKSYKAKTIALAENFLKNLRGPFGEWEKQARYCVGVREAAVTGIIRSGMKGPFLVQAHATRVQTYVLPKLLGESWHELCEAAVTAGNSMANQ